MKYLGPLLALHMNLVTGLARLAGQTLSSVHMGNFSPVTEMNKAWPFKFYPGNRAGVFILENFQPGYQDLGCKNQDLGNRASLPSHTDTSKFLQRSPVDRAYMKRPLVSYRCEFDKGKLTTVASFWKAEVSSLCTSSEHFTLLQRRAHARNVIFRKLTMAVNLPLSTPRW